MNQQAMGTRSVAAPQTQLIISKPHTEPNNKIYSHCAGNEKGDGDGGGDGQGDGDGDREDDDTGDE